MLLLRKGCRRSLDLSFNPCGCGKGGIRGISATRTQRWRRIISAEPGSSSSRGLPLLVPALTHSRSLYNRREAAAAALSTTGTPRLSDTTGSFPSNSFTLSSSRSRNRSPTNTAFLRSQTTPRSVLSLSATIPIRFYSHKATPKTSTTPITTPSTTPLPIMYEGKWTANTVRKTFLEYFAERGHTIGTMLYPSA